MADGLNFSRRLRRTPYTASAEKVGVTGFSVVNHMLLPKAYGRSVEDDYWHLREHVQIWDVACQRQVQIQGRDAAKLVQWMTPRDISRARVGDCLYVPIPPSFDALADLCASTKTPINALAAGPYTKFNRRQFAEIGVARISLGSALARATHKLIRDAANAMLQDGDFRALGGVSGDEIDALLATGAS